MLSDFFFLRSSQGLKFLSVLRYVAKELYFIHVCEKQFSNKVTVHKETKAS